jgi:hypothetical protein
MSDVPGAGGPVCAKEFRVTKDIKVSSKSLSLFIVVVFRYLVLINIQNDTNDDPNLHDNAPLIQ